MTGQIDVAVYQGEIISNVSLPADQLLIQALSYVYVCSQTNTSLNPRLLVLTRLSLVSQPT